MVPFDMPCYEREIGGKSKISRDEDDSAPSTLLWLASMQGITAQENRNKGFAGDG
jgi:hypothetical protein